MANKGPQALPEPPVEKIREVAEQHPEVYLVVRKQDPKGQWASLPSFTKPITDLMDGSLEEYFRTLPGGGGGRYRVQALSVHDHNEQVVPAYFTPVSGPANPWARGPQQAPPGQPQSRFGPPSMPGMSPGMAGMPWGAPMPAMLPRFSDQAAEQLDPSQFMSQTPDQIAMHFNAAMQAELGQIKKDREEERRRHEERLEEERARTRKLESELMELRRTHEVQMLELRMEMMGQARNDAPRTDYAAMLTAVAPIFAAFMESSTTRATKATEAQQKATELQMNGMQTLLAQAAQQKKSDDSGTKMLETLMPLVLMREEEKSPSKMADLVATMADGNMTQLSLVAQILQNMMPEGDDPMTELVKSAIDGMQNVAEVWADKNAPTQPAPPAVGAGQQTPQLTAESSPKDFADAIWQSPGLPQDFRTKEWYNLFIAIHDQDRGPDIVAGNLAKYLDESYDAGVIPATLKPIFESDVAPSNFLRPFLLQLPVAQISMQRLDAICSAFDSAMIVEESAAPVSAATFTPMQASPIIETEGEVVDGG